MNICGCYLDVQHGLVFSGCAGFGPGLSGLDQHGLDYVAVFTNQIKIKLNASRTRRVLDGEEKSHLICGLGLIGVVTRQEWWEIGNDGLWIL